MNDTDKHIIATKIFFAKHSLSEDDYIEFCNQHLRVSSFDYPDGFFNNKLEIDDYYENWRCD